MLRAKRGQKSLVPRDTRVLVLLLLRPWQDREKGEGRGRRRRRWLKDSDARTSSAHASCSVCMCCPPPSTHPELDRYRPLRLQFRCTVTPQRYHSSLCKSLTMLHILAFCVLPYTGVVGGDAPLNRYSGRQRHLLPTPNPPLGVRCDCWTSRPCKGTSRLYFCDQKSAMRCRKFVTRGTEFLATVLNASCSSRTEAILRAWFN